MDLFIVSEEGLIPLLECTVIDTVRDATCTAFARDGKVYVASCEYYCVHVLNENGQPIRDVIGKHGKGKLEFIGPKQVVCHDNAVYVMETFGNRIQIFEESTGQFISFFKMSTAHKMPRAFCVSFDGYIYVATERRSVCVYHSNGNLIHTFDTGLNRTLTGIAVDLERNIHVSSHSGVRVFSIEGDHLRDYATDQWATAVSVIGEGLALVCSKGCLAVYSSSGQLICDYRGLFYPYHVIMGPDESIWITCEEGIIILPQLCLPPFSLSLQCNRAILLEMDSLPVSLLPSYFGRVFSEWSHQLDIEIYEDNNYKALRSEGVKIKPGIPLPVVHQFVSFKLGLPTRSCFWFKNSIHGTRLCLRDGTFDKEWINIKKFCIKILFLK